MLWLRIYAIKLANGVYIITGGAIKLTATMQERKHTQAEVSRWLSGNHNFTLATLGKMWLPQLSDAYKFQKNSLIIKYFCRLVMVMSKIMFTFVFRTR